MPLRDLMRRRDDLLTPTLRRFRSYMEANDLPAGYADPAMLGRALPGIGQRLSRGNPLDTALPVLLAHEDELDRRFELFFPQLRGFVAAWIEKAQIGPGGLDVASPASGEGKWSEGLIGAVLVFARVGGVFVQRLQPERARSGTLSPTLSPARGLPLVAGGEGANENAALGAAFGFYLIGAEITSPDRRSR